MSKMIIDCADPNDLDELERAVEQAAGKCTITYFRQHQEMVKAGTSKSKSESAKIIAADTEESPEAVRKRIERGEKASGQLVQQKSNQPEKQQVTSKEIPNLTDAGGKREGAGRRSMWANYPKNPKENQYTEVFKEAFDIFLDEVKDAKAMKWQETSKEAVLKHIKILYDVATIT